MISTYLKLAGLFLIAAFVFGVLAPSLISAQSTVAFVIGVLVIVGFPAFAWWAIRKMFFTTNPTINKIEE